MKANLAAQEITRLHTSTDFGFIFKVLLYPVEEIVNAHCHAND